MVRVWLKQQVHLAGKEREPGNDEEDDDDDEHAHNPLLLALVSVPVT